MFLSWSWRASERDRVTRARASALYSVHDKQRWQTDTRHARFCSGADSDQKAGSRAQQARPGLTGQEPSTTVGSTATPPTRRERETETEREPERESSEA